MSTFRHKFTTEGEQERVRRGEGEGSWDCLTRSVVGNKGKRETVLPAQPGSAVKLQTQKQQQSQSQNQRPRASPSHSLPFASPLKPATTTLAPVSQSVPVAAARHQQTQTESSPMLPLPGRFLCATRPFSKRFLLSHAFLAVTSSTAANATCWVLSALPAEKFLLAALREKGELIHLMRTDCADFLQQRQESDF